MHNRKISVVGLGYVGLPVAVAFGKQEEVVGFDVDGQRIAELKRYHDRTLEVETDELKASSIRYSDNPADLESADFHIVAVPTPIDGAKQPNLKPLLGAAQSVGSILKANDIVVFESTVYPGAVEEDCVPVLEQASGLVSGKDFFVGYSPERINPGDKEHTFTTIKKVVAGQDEQTCRIIADVYSSVVTAGVYEASTIKVAEAAKVIENTQRDLNIALMNELAVIFARMGIDTHDVLAAASSKWNFLPFKPGLVGGHCIGVDPYYLTFKAQQLGYHPEVILSGRRINDNMGKFVVEQCVKRLIHQGNAIKGAKIGVLGLTFKEDCPDLRNSRVIDVITELQSYHTEVLVCDPMADAAEAKEIYGVELKSIDELSGLDAVILCVAHQSYASMTADQFKLLLGPNGLVFDVKSVLDREQFSQAGIDLFRL